MFKWSYIFITFLFLAPITISYAQISTLDKGSRVKIISSKGLWYSGNYQKKIVGNLISISTDTLKIANGNNEYKIPESDIRRLYISVGKRRKTLEGIIIGTASGTVFGTFIGYLNEPKGPEKYGPFVFERNPFWGFSTAFGAIIGGLGGGILGGVFGSNYQMDRWSRIPTNKLPNVSLYLEPVSRFTGICIRFTF